MARRRFKRAGFNTKLIMDVGLAGLAIRILPSVINKFFPLDPTLYAVVGAGGTYVVGSMLKKPDLANAGIALGFVEVIAPMVEDLIGGITDSKVIIDTTKQPLGIAYTGRNKPDKTVVGIKDYLRLNDYVSMPGVPMDIGQYRNSY